MSSNVICIAGAHRSGTSMLARLLYQCGLDLGAASDLMPAAADNPDGFWEHLRFVQLADELLNAVGAAWDLPPKEGESFGEANLEPIRAKARLLLEGFQDKPIWGWKDPRNCVTLPFWRTLLPGLKTIIIFRNPLEAAYSMHKRNGTSYALGLRLWEIYNRRLLANTEPSERIVTHYQSFFEDPQTQLQKIATFAGLTENATYTAASLVAVNRRHTTFTIEQMIDAGVSDEILKLYRSLIAGSTEGSGGQKKTRGNFEIEDDQLAGAESKLNLSIPEGEDVRRELAFRRGAEIQHREEVARHQKTIERLRAELAAKSVSAAAEINRRDGRIEELQKNYARLDQRLDRELDQRNRREEELARLRERFTQTNQLLQRISIRLADFEARNASLTERLRKHLLEMKRLLRLLDQMKDAANLLRRSRRWKLANPVTALRAAFGGKSLQGYGHLDRNVEKYRSWRLSHPEVDSLADEIQALRPREIPEPVPPLDIENPVRPNLVAPARPRVPIKPIEFRPHAQVEISIVIPVYNQIDFTRACLASVQEHSGEIPYEVIVVDDASTDATSEIVAKIPGIIYLRAEANAGFIASCNRGAEAARGKYLLFLNNDTTVTAGWLTALHDTFGFAPEAGLVGSKLVYPDGRLQEAGGIIWRDGSGWNRGKFQDPNQPEYNYLREVNYCSAASVMIPKALFENLHGFDSKYAPAYYEDTDLAFKVAQSGRKVLYQPLSVVLHYEGITSGTDISTGTKKYQEVNRTTFVATWKNTLAALPKNGDIESFYAPHEPSKRILVIDHHLPMADRDSGSLRMFHILTILRSLGHQVTFIPDNLADIPPYGDELRKRGILFLHHPYIKSIRDYLKAEGDKFDLIILSRCDFARKHVAFARAHAPRARLIFDTVDLHFLRETRLAELANDPLLQEKAAEKRRLEYDLIDQTDQTWVVSPAEQELLRAARPDKSIEIVSNIVNVPESAVPFALRNDILFIGSFLHPPNTDAVLFFARDIFPLVQKRLPQVKFYIIGDKAPPEIMALADEHIVVTGYQPDVNCYFDHIKLSVAPLRYGAGVKGKINQSMSFGVPVVATPIAVEGMPVIDGEDVAIAEEPAVFAEKLTALYLSEELWQRVSRNSIAKTRKFFSMEAAGEQLEKLLNAPQTNNLPVSAALASVSRHPVTA